MVSATKTAKRVRRLSPEELQEVLEAQSACLPEEAKATHPARSFAPNYGDLRTKMPDRSIAVVPTDVDPAGNVIRGHLITSAPSRDTLDAAIAHRRAAHPEVGISVFFTGHYAFGGTLAVA